MNLVFFCKLNVGVWVYITDTVCRWICWHGI